MWDLIVSVPDHCLSFYFTRSRQEHVEIEDDLGCLYNFLIC